MWSGNAESLRMTEGDWGVALPFVITGATLTANDSFKFVFRKKINGGTVAEKTYSNVSHNTVQLSFTAEESAQFTPGWYVYSLDWYQSGSFLCNVIANGQLLVEEKV